MVDFGRVWNKITSKLIAAKNWITGNIEKVITIIIAGLAVSGGMIVSPLYTSCCNHEMSIYGGTTAYTSFPLYLVFEDSMNTNHHLQWRYGGNAGDTGKWALDCDADSTWEDYLNIDSSDVNDDRTRTYDQWISPGGSYPYYYVFFSDSGNDDAGCGEEYYYVGNVQVDAGGDDTTCSNSYTFDYSVDTDYYSSSDIGNLKLYVDGSQVDSCSFSGDTSCSYTMSGLSGGDHDYYARITGTQPDEPSSSTYTVTVDETPPSSSISPDGTGDWVSGESYTVDCSDESGCNTIYWEETSNGCDDTDWLSNSGSPPESDTISCSSGSTCQIDVCYGGEDDCGNIESSLRSSTFYIDKKAPIITSASDDSGGVIAPGTTVTATVDWSDDEAGLSYAWFYHNKSGSWSQEGSTSLSGSSGSYSDSITTDSSDIGKTICWRQEADDTVNNRNTGMSQTAYCFTVNSPPNINMVSPSDGYISSSTSVDFEFNASDSEDDTFKLNMTVDGNLEYEDTSYSDGTTISKTVSGLVEGDYTWTVMAEDSSGLVSSNSRSFTVDTTVPDSSISPDGMGWRSSDTSYTISCSDSETSCSTTYWEEISSGGSCPSQGSFANSGTPSVSDTVTCSTGSICERDICYYSVDVAGNTESTERSNTFKIDKKEPLYSNVGDNSSGRIKEGEVVRLYTFWEDSDAGLDMGEIYENSTGVWTKIDTKSFGSANSDWSNMTIGTVNDGGKTVCWRQYANDTVGNKNTDMANQCFYVEHIIDLSGELGGGINSIDFEGSLPSAQNPATNQTDSIGLFNITNIGTTAEDINIYVNTPSTPAYPPFNNTINITCDNDNTYSGGVLLRSTKQLVYSSLAEESSTQIWCWADFAESVDSEQYYIKFNATKA